jgi:hypothetical protein
LLLLLHSDGGFEQLLAVFGGFCTEWTLRRIPFYGFVHFAAFQMLAGVHSGARVGKVSTEVLNCGRETSRVQK